MDESPQLYTTTFSSDVEVAVRDKLSALRGSLGACSLGVHTIEPHHLWSLHDGLATTSDLFPQEEVANIRQQIEAITVAAESPEDGRCAASSIVPDGELPCQQVTTEAPSDTSPMVAQTHSGSDEQQEQQPPQSFERMEDIAGAVEPPCKKLRKSEMGAKLTQYEERLCERVMIETVSCTSPTLTQTQDKLEQQEQQQVEVAACAGEPPHKKLRRCDDGTDLTCVVSTGALPCADEIVRQKLVAITPLGRLSVGNHTEYDRQQQQPQPPPPQNVQQLEGMAVAAGAPHTESVNRSGILQYALAPFASLYCFAVALKKRARPDADVA